MAYRRVFKAVALLFLTAIVAMALGACAPAPAAAPAG